MEYFKPSVDQTFFGVGGGCGGGCGPTQRYGTVDSKHAYVRV